MLRQSADDSSFIGPVIVWLAIQLLALLLAAGHVRLWSGSSRATESLAINELLIAQFIASSLLFPSLCRSWQSTTALVIASLPMIGLAGVLADVQMTSCVAIAIDVCLWLFGLFFWRRVLTSPPAQLISVSLVTTLTITSAMLAYFAAEMRNAPIDFPFLPLFAAMAAVHGHLFVGFIANFGWLLASILLTKFFATSYPQEVRAT